MKPIIFSGPMVEAILERKKTMMRRVLKPHNPVRAARMGGYKQGNGLWIDDEKTVDAPNGYIKDYSISSCWMTKETYISKYAPYQPGNVLWVRETWDCMPTSPHSDIWDLMYAADGNFNYGVKIPNFNPMLYTPQRWRPSIHMRREMARIFLKVKAVRVERLKDMSEEDAVAEGAVKKPHYIRYGGENCLAIHGRYKKEFAKLWDTLNAKRGYGWDSNPWVWVVEFERIDE